VLFLRPLGEHHCNTCNACFCLLFVVLLQPDAVELQQRAIDISYALEKNVQNQNSLWKSDSDTCRQRRTWEWSTLHHATWWVSVSTVTVVDGAGSPRSYKHGTGMKVAPVTESWAYRRARAWWSNGGWWWWHLITVSKCCTCRWKNDTCVDYIIYCILIPFWVTRWVLGGWLAGFWSSSLDHTWQRRHVFLNSLYFRDIFYKLAGFWLCLVIEMLDFWTRTGLSHVCACGLWPSTPATNTDLWE
jgi:hypothetical protein